MSATRLLCATVALVMMSGLPAGAETDKFDASKLRSLLDKDQSLSSKDRSRLTFKWVRQLQSHIAACWHPPKEVTDQTNVGVRILIELKPDGSLKSAPSLVQVTKDTLTKAYVETVVSAIKSCQPYAFLPAEEYKGGWDKLDMTFTANPTAATELKSENEKLVKGIRERLHRRDVGGEH